MTLARRRDSLFNRAANSFMRRRAERAMRHDLAFAAADTAVVLVACQNDLFAPGGRGEDLTAGPGAAAAVGSALARLVETARQHRIRIVHAPQAGFAGRTGEMPLCPIQAAMQARSLFADGSAGAAPRETVTPAVEEEVRAPHHGLSAFAGTGLAEHLRKAGARRIVIAGALTDVQVDSTARDAVELGFQTMVLADCCLASSDRAGERALTVTLPRLVHAVSPLSAFAARLAVQVRSTRPAARCRPRE